MSTTTTIQSGKFQSDSARDWWLGRTALAGLGQPVRDKLNEGQIATDLVIACSVHSSLVANCMAFLLPKKSNCLCLTFNGETEYGYPSICGRMSETDLAIF